MTQRPDDATAKDSGGGFDPHSEGQFPMLCVDVVNLGVKVEQYAEQEPREVPKVGLVFASGERQKEHADELTLVITEMTLSANEKANLRKFVEAWRGKSYTAEQAQAGIPVTKLYGQLALVSIEHVTTKRGHKFAKIVSIGPLPKSMEVTNATIKELLQAYTRPQFLEDKKGEYSLGLAKHRAMTGESIPSGDNSTNDIDDPLPF